MNYKIVVFGVKDTTTSILQHIRASGYQVDLLVTIDQDVLSRNHVAGFQSLDEIARQLGIEVFKVSDYAMLDERCKKFFSGHTFDIGISMGWQRLIPEYVLNQFSHGIFGFHGSCGYLPFGRGRSPINWSLIMGDTRFIMNLFRYDRDADSPNVYRNTMFEITPYDTIRTLQYKNILSAKRMIAELLRDYQLGNIRVRTDFRDMDSWYKKRTPADGKINFAHRTREIYNLIRGVTRPFPGAFAVCRDQHIVIWKAVPFDQILDFSDNSPGQVIDVFDGNLLVRTVDGSLLITDYECDVEIKARDMLE